MSEETEKPQLGKNAVIIAALTALSSFQNEKEVIGEDPSECDMELNPFEYDMELNQLEQDFERGDIPHTFGGSRF